VTGYADQRIDGQEIQAKKTGSRYSLPVKKRAANFAGLIGFGQWRYPLSGFC